MSVKFFHDVDNSLIIDHIPGTYRYLILILVHYTVYMDSMISGFFKITFLAKYNTCQFLWLVFLVKGGKGRHRSAIGI